MEGSRPRRSFWSTGHACTPRNGHAVGDGRWRADGEGVDLAQAWQIADPVLTAKGEREAAWLRQVARGVFFQKNLGARRRATRPRAIASRKAREDVAPPEWLSTPPVRGASPRWPPSARPRRGLTVALLFFKSIGACRRRTPRTAADLKEPKDERSHRDFSDVVPPLRSGPRCLPSAITNMP